MLTVVLLEIVPFMEGIVGTGATIIVPFPKKVFSKIVEVTGIPFLFRTCFKVRASAVVSTDSSTLNSPIKDEIVLILSKLLGPKVKVSISS